MPREKTLAMKNIDFKDKKQCGPDHGFGARKI